MRRGGRCWAGQPDGPEGVVVELAARQSAAPSHLFGTKFPVLRSKFVWRRSGRANRSKYVGAAAVYRGGLGEEGVDIGSPPPSPRPSPSSTCCYAQAQVQVHGGSVAAETHPTSQPKATRLKKFEYFRRRDALICSTFLWVNSEPIVKLRPRHRKISSLFLFR